MLRLVVEAGPPRSDRPSGRLVGSWRDAAGSPFAHAHADGGRYRFTWSGAAEFHFSPPDPIVTAFLCDGVAPESIRQLFHRAVEPIVRTAYGQQALHGSAVCSPAGAVVFTGEGGQGKSTFAYGLALTRAWIQLADDAVVFEVRSQQVVIHPLDFVPRLRADSQRHFGRGHSLARRETTEDRIPVRAIVFLERQDFGAPAVTVKRLSQAAAFQALLPQAHRLDPTNRVLGARFAADYLTLAEQVPAYVASYGSCLDRFPENLDAVVSAIAE
jgi:hypothetical protein